MKKIVLLLIAVIGLGITAKAQDVILKQDGSEITAKVLEITDQQVKYKDFDFQGGPTRNINISEIFMITYENGQREVFQHRSPTQQKNLYSDLQKEFYRIGNDDKAMLKFFNRKEFVQYYTDFESACDKSNSGKTCLGVGLGFTGVGIIFMGAGIGAHNAGVIVTGCVFLGVGEILTIVSIPVSAVAGGRKRAIKNDFAREYFSNSAYTYQPTLNLNCTGNGLGISLKF